MDFRVRKIFGTFEKRGPHRNELIIRPPDNEYFKKILQLGLFRLIRYVPSDFNIRFKLHRDGENFLVVLFVEVFILATE